MRKLIVSMNVTLDGFLSGSNCEMDWHFKYWSADMIDALCSELHNADTILMGRVTYEVFSKFANPVLQSVATGRENIPFFEMMNCYKKIVFSKSLKVPTWQNSIVCNTTIASKIKALKKQVGKNIILYGSAKLLRVLQQANLVDEYQLYIHPVLLGDGKRMFQNNSERIFFQSRTLEKFSSGVVLMHIAICRK